MSASRMGGATGPPVGWWVAQICWPVKKIGQNNSSLTCSQFSGKFKQKSKLRPPKWLLDVVIYTLCGWLPCRLLEHNRTQIRILLAHSEYGESKTGREHESLEASWVTPIFSTFPRCYKTQRCTKV